MTIYTKDLCNLFNQNQEKALNNIRELAKQAGVEPEQGIAEFLFYENESLSKDMVNYCLGDSRVLGDQYKKVLEYFTSIMSSSFKGKSFVESLNMLLEQIALTQDVRILDKLFHTFAESYVHAYSSTHDVKPTLEEIKNLAQDSIALNYVLLNKNIKVENISADYSSSKIRDRIKSYEDKFNDKVFDKISSAPIKMNIIQAEQGSYFSAENNDQKNIIKNLSDFIVKQDNKNLYQAFPNLSKDIKVSVDKKLGWLNKLTGYNGTIVLKNSDGKNLVNIDVYVPNIFSKMLFGIKETVKINSDKLSEAKQNDLRDWSTKAAKYAEKYTEESTKSLEIKKEKLELWNKIAKEARNAFDSEKDRYNTSQNLAQSLTSYFNNAHKMENVVTRPKTKDSTSCGLHAQAIIKNRSDHKDNRSTNL